MQKNALIRWTALAGVLATAPVAQAQTTNPFEAQMEAVVQIGSEAIDVRLDRGLELVSEARADAIGVLQVADALGVDSETLERAEIDAYSAVREAAALAHADLRGMAINTVTTLRNFGGTQEQISTILELWEAHADNLDTAIDLALDDVDATTPVSTQAISAGLVPVDFVSSDMLVDAELVFEAMALEMEAQIRAETDDLVRFLRVEVTRSLHPRDERSLFGDATRSVKQDCKVAEKTLKEQFRAYNRAMRQAKAPREDRRALRAAYLDAREMVRWAWDDAQEDINAAR